MRSETMYAIARVEDARKLGEFVPVTFSRGFHRDVYRGGYTLGEGAQMCNTFAAQWNPDLHAYCAQVLGNNHLCVVEYQEHEEAPTFPHVTVRVNYGRKGSRFEEKLELT